MPLFMDFKNNPNNVGPGHCNGQYSYNAVNSNTFFTATDSLWPAAILSIDTVMRYFLVYTRLINIITIF